MSAINAHNAPLYWAGVALGPLAWGINLQAAYALMPHACAGSSTATIALSIAMALLAACGGLISLRSAGRDAPAEWIDAQGGRARDFMAWLGVGSGVIFALVILNQLVATVMIQPCLR